MAPATPLLLHVFPSFAVGGAQVRFAALANRFGREWRHAVIALDGVTDCAARLSPELDVTFPAVALRKGNLLGNVPAIRRLLRTLRPDVLVTSNWGSIEWALANLLPLARHVHTEDGFGPEERDRQLLRRVLARRLALRRSAVVLPSRNLLRIATETWRLNPARLHYIPNGVDLARFAVAGSAAAAAVRERWPGQGPVVGIVAALRPEKNVARLLRAFARVELSARLVIVGDGSERGSLENLAQALAVRDRVYFAGHVTEPAPLYDAFDVFALSSDTEQMPLSMLEAMAAGLPVATTDVGDVRIMLAPENASAIVPAADEALAQALRLLLGDAALRHRMGMANRAKVEHDYQQEAMFQSYARILVESVIKGGNETG